MTRRGKCDICRVRKVKCDQKRPACSPCSKKGRCCTYKAASSLGEGNESMAGSHGSAGSPYQNRDLPLTLRRAAPSGDGVYYTFVTGKGTRILGDPAWPLSNVDTRRTAKWTGMIKESYGTWSWFDQFLSCVTVRIGSDPVLDRAADFTMDSYATFKRNWNPTFDDVAQKSGIVAMTALRNAISGKRGAGNTGIVVTAGLFCVAELFRSMGGVMNYLVHLKACARLLAFSVSTGNLSELEEILLYMICFEEVDFALTRGSSTVFEGITLPPFRFLGKYWQSEECVNALSTIFNLFVPLPQLSIFVREYDPDTADEIDVLKTMNLIRSLHESGREIEALLDELVTTIPTPYPHMADILPLSYTFRSTNHFDLVQHYFTYRILLCGLTQAFCKALGPTQAASFIDLSAVQEDEEINNRKLTMCIHYAMNHCAEAPCVAARVNTPLTHAFAAWERIERRKAAGETPLLVRESLEAGDLKRFTFRHLCDGMLLWGIANCPTEEYILTCCEAALGGPAITSDHCWAVVETLIPRSVARKQAWTMIEPLVKV